MLQLSRPPFSRVSEGNDTGYTVNELRVQGKCPLLPVVFCHMHGAVFDSRILQAARSSTKM